MMIAQIESTHGGFTSFFNNSPCFLSYWPHPILLKIKIPLFGLTEIKDYAEQSNIKHGHQVVEFELMSIGNVYG